MKLKNIATRKIRRELARREASAGKLQSQHADLSARLARLASELADLGVDGTPAGRGRPPGRRGPGRPKGSKNKPGKMGRPKGKRAKNAMSLADAVAKVVAAGKTVSPSEVMGAVKKFYKSTSKNLGMMVANTLAKHPEFKRLGRGQYQRVGGGKASAKPTAKAKPAGKKRSRRVAKKKAAAKKAVKGVPASNLGDVVARS